MANLPPGFRVLQTTPQSGVPEGFRIEQEGTPPSTFEDIARTVPSTLGRGVMAIPGMVGDTMGLGMLAGRKIDQLLGNPVKSEAEVWNANPLSAITSGALEQGYENVTGTQFHDPVTEGGRVTDAILRPVPGAMAMGGGNPIKSGVKYGAIPGAAGEGASQVAEGLGLDPSIQDTARVAAEVGTGGAMSLTKPRDVSPTIKQLSEQASRGFQAVEQANVRVNQTGLAKLAADAQQEANKRLTGIAEIDRALQPDTLQMVRAVGAMAQQGTVPLTTVHKYRQMINSELQRPDIRPADKAVLTGMKRRIDDFFENLSPSQIAGGNAGTGKVLRQAIKDYAQEQRALTIQRAMEVAESRVDPKTGYTREDAMRMAFKNLWRDEDAMAGFTKKERQAIYEVGHGAPIARALSGFAPNNNFANIMRLAFMGGAAGSAFGSPAAGGAVTGIAAGAGALGKAASAAATRRNVARADQMVRGGAGSVPRGPMMAPLSLYYTTTGTNMATSPPPKR